MKFSACMANRMAPRSFWLVLALVCFVPLRAWSLDPDKSISQYGHMVWRVQDGYFQSTPTSVVQTRDGYLWIGTRSGLLRFNGISFLPWTPLHGEHLLSSEVRSLVAARDGSLWIATRGGLSHWADQILTNYPTGTGGVGSILEDAKGNIWFTLLDPAPGSGPLCQVVGTHVRCYGPAEGVPSFRTAATLIEDGEGNFWVGGDTTLLRWKPGSNTVYSPRVLKANSGMDGIFGLASTRDGTLWVGIAKAGPGGGVQQIVQGRWMQFKTAELDGSALNVSNLYLDREGALWVGTYDRGIYRIHGTQVDHFGSALGLSSDCIWSISEDREGNVWVATSQGLDRLTDTPVISFSTNEGLCSGEVASVLASRDGSVLSGGGGALTILRNKTVSCLKAGKGLPGSQVTSLFEDHAGRLWVGLDNTLWLYAQRRFTRVRRPDGGPIGVVSGITEDVANNIWIEVIGPPRTLMRLEDHGVRELYPEPQLPAGRRVAADPTGGIWVGLFNGDLAHYQNGKFVKYQFTHDNAALLHQLLANSDGSVLAATSYGLIGRSGGKLLTLTTRNGLPCDAVYAITLDAQANLWLFMDCALGEIASTDVEKWRRSPEITVPVRTLDALDGVRTGRAPFVAAARSRDGRLWFANEDVLEMVDPAHLSLNSLPPPVHIEKVVSDHKSYPVTGNIHLPPLVRDLEIDYAGLSFVAPQKVLFRYRLDGHDRAWQEPGMRRQAFYNDLSPGTYRFRVIACNNEGLWNEEGAVLDFTVAPAWYQTNSFLVFCIGTAMFAVWALYRLRMRQVARSLSARFDERLAERTRIAHELHDTFLQTVQGSRLVADDALDNSADPLKTHHALVQLSEWLARATDEGRAALNSLRSSTKQTNDLAEGLRRAAEECRGIGPMNVSFSVQGPAREMHPVVRDEIYRIGYEAVRNACTHSAASEMQVELKYTRDLALRVSDNGVGIDSSVLHGGKDGHFGLRGMRERAVRIGANLRIASSANSGTEIIVVVPGKVVFRSEGTLVGKLRKRLLFGRGFKSG